MAATRIFPGVCAVLSAMILTGCAREPSAQLFPINHKPYAGVLTATISGFEQGHGAIEIATRYGEVFDGDYSIVLGNIPRFGGILAAGHGPRGCVSQYGYSSDFAACGIGEGTASLISNWGTSMQCEFLNDDPRCLLYTSPSPRD